MAEFSVHLEASAAVGVEIKVEAANEEEAQRTGELWLAAHTQTQANLVVDLVRPTSEATEGYAKAADLPVVYVTAELDEAGFEVVDVFPAIGASNG